MNEVLTQIGKVGIVPVVVIEDAGDAVPLARALCDGGLPIAEVTFRTAAAEEAIRRITSEAPGMLVGAGTVLTTQQARQAIDAGARFIVSPGINTAVVEFCVDRGVPITPGCSNPTNIETALGYGLDVVKFFPAEASGGLQMLKAISAPYGMMKFIPTGGIDASNINGYLAFSKVLACGGSWMVKPELIKAKNFGAIVDLTREAVSTMLGFELAHVGINTASAEASTGLAQSLGETFAMPVKEGNSSNFVGPGLEILKSVGRGSNGHIAIKTNSVDRAIAYLGRLGVEVDMSTARGPEGAPPASVYLKDSFGGFAIHLLQGK